MIVNSNLLIKFISSCSKVLITAYIWLFCGFLIPNLELNRFYLPESTEYKTIVLMMIGTFVFTTLGYCFRFLAVHIIVFLFCIRFTTFMNNFGFFDSESLINNNMSYLGLMLMSIPLEVVINSCKAEIDFF